jgi:hypothetical protein
MWPEYLIEVGPIIATLRHAKIQISLEIPREIAQRNGHGIKSFIRKFCGHQD